MAKAATNDQLKRERLQLQEEKLSRMRFNRAAYLFPDEGPLRRELYSKHISFFTAGATFKERCVLGGSRSGKTLAGAYEAMCHSSGRYPDWWEGSALYGVITRNPSTGVLQGGADPRSEAYAVGY